MDEFSYDISRKNINTGIVETLLPPGYFCSDVTLLVVGDSLYFHNLMDIYHLDTVSLDLTNITNGVHKNGLNKLQYVDGYLYYYTYGEYENNLGPTCYVTHNYIISIQNAEDTRTDNIIIIDFEGNDLSPSFPGLIH